MKTRYYLEIRETENDGFAIFGGENADQLSEVGREPTYSAATKYRRWWIDSMGLDPSQVCQGFRPLRPMQGHIAGH